MPSMKADRDWIEEFRIAYDHWLAEAMPLLERGDYQAAFRFYPFPEFETIPWTPVTKPLAASRLAVVTTAGTHRTGVDAPFRHGPEGDVSLRRIPGDVALADLDVSHSHMPEQIAREDMNTVFPLDHLRELVAAGALGSLAGTHFSLMGYATRAADIAETVAPEIAEAMAQDRVDLALLVPV
jgi:D-proline reductase (dithiol) PrdB